MLIDRPEQPLRGREYRLRHFRKSPARFGGRPIVVIAKTQPPGLGFQVLGVGGVGQV